MDGSGDDRRIKYPLIGALSTLGLFGATLLLAVFAPRGGHPPPRHFIVELALFPTLGFRLAPYLDLPIDDQHLSPLLFLAATEYFLVGAALGQIVRGFRLDWGGAELPGVYCIGVYLLSFALLPLVLQAPEFAKYFVFSVNTQAAAESIRAIGNSRRRDLLPLLIERLNQDNLPGNPLGVSPLDETTTEAITNLGGPKIWIEIMKSENREPCNGQRWLNRLKLISRAEKANTHRHNREDTAGTAWLNDFQSLSEAVADCLLSSNSPSFGSIFQLAWCAPTTLPRMKAFLMLHYDQIYVVELIFQLRLSAERGHYARFQSVQTDSRYLRWKCAPPLEKEQYALELRSWLERYSADTSRKANFSDCVLDQ